MTALRFEVDDGGREAAGYRGNTGDCGVRAIAIAGQLPYQEAYDLVNEWAKSERKGKRKSRRSNARTGVYSATVRRELGKLGCWSWTPTMQIGSGCTVHLAQGELPLGRLIACVSKHYCAVIDGVVRDNHDPTRDGTRCVYGYWEFLDIPA